MADNSVFLGDKPTALAEGGFVVGRDASNKIRLFTIGDAEDIANSMPAQVASVAGVKGALDALEAALTVQIEGAAEGIIAFRTWPELASVSGTIDGQQAKVTSDNSSHIDPVSGDTVDNAGAYRWSVSPAGWERIGPLLDSSALSAIGDEIQSARDGSPSLGDRLDGIDSELGQKATSLQGGKADTALQPGAAISNLADTTSFKKMTSTERTKLSGVAEGATANSPDASLRDRSTHTGTQAPDTVVGLPDLFGAAVRRADLGSIRPSSFFNITTVEQGFSGDSSDKLEDALESGYVLDTRKETLLVNRNIRPLGGFKGIKALIVKQLNPDADGRRTLDIRNLSDFLIEDVVVDGNGIKTYTGVDQPVSNRGMAFLLNCSRFLIRGYEAKNGGVGNGLALEACTDFEITHIHVHDMAYDVAAEVNDWIDGILINGCERGVLNGFRVRDLKGKIGGSDNRRWSRGVALGNNKNCVFANGAITATDVGLDVTGGVGNDSCVIANMVVDDQYTFGFKFANSQRRLVGTGLISRYAGLSSFVFSAPAVLGIGLSSVTQDIMLDGILGYNPGATTDVLPILDDQGNPTGNIVRNGVTILPPQAEYANYPQGIRISNALMMDDRGVGAKMQYGYRNAQNHPGTVGHKRNELNETCKSQGHTSARQLGFHYARVSLTSSNTAFALASGSFTDLPWNTEVEDSCNAHSTSSNLEQVKILEDGWYKVSLTVTFDANATGRRGARFRTISPAMTYPPEWSMAINGGVTVLTMDWEGVLLAGDTAIAQAMQESGGSLNVNLNGSRFIVRKIGEL